MWFGLFNYWQGKLILAAIIYLVFSCFDAKEANKGIDKINEQNLDNYHIKSMHRAPYASLICIIIILIIALVFPLTLSEVSD